MNAFSPRYVTVLAAALACVAIAGCASHGIAYKQVETPSFDTRKLNDPASEERVARTALQTGDVQLATNVYTRMLAQDPRSVTGMTGLGDTLYLAGDLTRAAVYYDKALAEDPRSVPALSGRARVSLRLRRFDVAIASFRQVLALQPNQPMAQAGLGAALDLSGDHAGAQAELRDALTRNPGDPSISINLGMSLIMAGRPREAVDVLTDVTRFPAAPPQAFHDLALAYGMLGNTQAASELLSRDLPAQDVNNDLRFYAYQRERRQLAAAAVPTLPADQAANVMPLGNWGAQGRLTEFHGQAAGSGAPQ
ncbi:tetratricopeptide repeat protein [Burkholderia sp. Ac-20379]|uniref:tetratricopeptide repeat protein n=1 Tax=Burkholderia sp. Ac-20379 TaxID=2703900 RepID=UPI0019801325|nr:tetratricopeptide repeat protein [Burkholderia sp. Ac-20379]MBN3726366.1 tetratricopeptide repeat protein [Burkholderia sp. Ac-20379]